MTPVAAVPDRAAVLAWGMPRLRDLPWRRTRDPWRVLVAEVMLQQTQAARVVPKWLEFVDRYPQPAALSAAPLADVLVLWQGLGYPRRARNLHLAAARIVADHGGHVPAGLDDLLALPGVGPYTARAVLAFAHAHDVGVVDTNIARILARTAGGRLTPGAAQRRADAWVPQGDGWAWNQVLMDLGAAVCRPTPDCDACPLAPDCAWTSAGRPAPDPAVGSAGVSTRQPQFARSARQARGAVLRELAAGPVDGRRFDADILRGLVADGLVERRGELVALPGPIAGA